MPDNQSSCMRCSSYEAWQWLATAGQVRKFIKDINELYGEYQAGADLEPRTPLTNYTTEDAEPGIVAERG